MKKNVKVENKLYTHEGAPAKHINKEQELRRTLMACMLWEKSFYEDGESVAQRIARLIPDVAPERVANMAVEARSVMHLRHVPLLVVREMARLPKHKAFVASTLEQVIQRADELAEFLAIYWINGKEPISKQVKMGLARAFQKFDEYQLAKYNRANTIKLRDVLFMVHAKPKDKAQAELWKRLVDDELKTPDTWEVTLSSRKEDPKEAWERLLVENKLGGLAFLRNLRNMHDARVDTGKVSEAFTKVNFSKVLPFRFVAAAKAAPYYETMIDNAMLENVKNKQIPGRTVIVIDVSGSMYGSPVSRKSDMDRALAACALGAIGRDMFEDVAIYATAGNDWTRDHKTAIVPSRRGMALVDAIYQMRGPLGGGGIFLTPVCRYLAELEENVDRMIVITDEQDCASDFKDSPNLAKPLGKFNYLINVASYQNGIGYGNWTHIDGWSEAVFNYIAESEKLLSKPKEE